VVLFAGRLAAAVADLVRHGGDERRRAVNMAFVRMGATIVEVVERPGPPVIWGLVAVVDELEALDGVGEVRDAVQPGRRIATARRAEGLETALAFMTPRVRAR
jgi:hypothetical protein